MGTTRVKITLIANDGAVPAKQNFEGEYGEGVVYTQPERAGYTFVGWKVKGQSDETAKYFLSFPEKDTTFEAVFEPEMVRVAYDTNGGSFSDENESGVRKGEAGSTYTPPAGPVRSGYNFKGWKLTLDGSKAAPDEAKIPTYSKTYYAFWEKKEVALTLNSTDAQQTTTQVCHGLFEEAVEYTMPVREGFAFLGWKQSGDVDASATMSIVYPAQDATLEAVWKEGASAVRFNVAGGSWDSSDGESGQRVGIKGESYDAPATPTRAGYTFKGWFSEAGEAGTELSEYKYPDSSNTTYYAHWEANEITVTLDAGSGANPQTQEMKGKCDEVIANIQTPARTGYTFSGWKTSSSDASATLTLTYPSDNATYTALWTENDVRVTLDANGGKFDGQESQDKIELDGYKGASYSDSIVEPKRDGYTFNGWWTLPIGGTQHTEATGLGTYPVSSTTYYAQWKEKDITVTLRSGEGSQTADQAISGKYGAAVNDYNVPKREGYAFVGWKLEGQDDSTAVAYFTFPQQDTTYDAVWEAGVSVVTFNTMGGTFTEEGEKALRKGATDTEYTAPKNPKRDGYTFLGWFDAKSGGNKVEFTDGKAKFSSTQVNTVYFAQWTIRDTSIQFMRNDGTDSVHQTLTGEALSAALYSVPERKGYSFVGWNTDSSATAGTFSLVFPATADDDSSTVTYYAIWSAYDNTVTYDAQGGGWKTSENDIRIGKTGSAMTPAAAPAKVGYAFKGWYTESTGGVEAPVLTAVPSESVRYYAHWDVAVNNVKLLSNKGTFADGVEKTYTGEYGSEVAYEIPTREGYIFKGWNESGSASSVYFSSIKYQGNDIELKAVWEASTSKIIFDGNGGTIVEGTTDTSANLKEYSGTVDSSNKNELPSATRKGYDFVGWFSAPTGGEKLSSAPSTYPTKDTKYYAQWTPSTIKLYLDLAGGNVDGETSIQTLQGKYGELVSYKAPVRVGYVFVGYKLSGTDDATATLNPTYPDENNLTFSAVWALDSTLTVNFNTMGGTYVGDAPQTTFTPTTTSDTTFVAPVAPSKEGYSFAGWSLDPSKSAIDTAAGDVTAGQSVNYPSKSTTYYAIWAVNEVGITLDANGGQYADGSETKTLSGPHGTSADYEAPTRHNYSFAGWLVNGTDVTYDVLFSADNEGKTYKALWAAGSATVTFIAVGVDSEGASKHYAGQIGDEFTVPANPARLGYLFTGWYDRSGKKLDVSAGDKVEFSDSVEHVYYARW